MSVKKLKKKLLKKPKRSMVPEEDLLHTGSTVLNCALSGNPRGGIPKGKFIYFVGDTSSGKTALTLTMLAEASINKEFDDYDLVHDDIEGGAMFNIRKLFGRKLYKRMEKKEPSQYLEEMYDGIDDKIQSKRKFIWITDSMDGLQPKEDEVKYQKQKATRKKKKHDPNAKDEAGSFGAAKAKINSQHLRRLMTPLRKSKSILVIVSQTRDSLGFGFNPKTRSGGKSLPFYASVEIWSSIKEKIYRTVKGKKYVIGVVSRLKIKKNRLTGAPDRTVDIPIYNSIGFDDVGSCVDFLISNKHWTKKGNGFHAKELKFTGTRERIIKHIQSAPIYYRKMQNAVGKVWNEIEDACKIDRKSRYE